MPLQQTLRHQRATCANFFAGRAKYPCFKTRDGRQSAHYTRSAFRLRDGTLTLAKHAAPLEFVWSWDNDTLATLNPTTVIVSGMPHRHHRDVNAAKNILAAGRAVAGERPGDACGADVRPRGTPLRQSAGNPVP